MRADFVRPTIQNLKALISFIPYGLFFTLISSQFGLWNIRQQQKMSWHHQSLYIVFNISGYFKDISSKEKQQILTFAKLELPKKSTFLQVIRGRFSTENNSLSTN